MSSFLKITVASDGSPGALAAVEPVVGAAVLAADCVVVGHHDAAAI